MLAPPGAAAVRTAGDHLMSKSDRTGDYDPAATHAELMKVLGLLSRGRPQDVAFLNRCRDEYRRQRNTKSKRWCKENGEGFARAAGSLPHAEHFAAVLFAVVRHLYSGETIWQNKRPRDAKLADARRMTPAELMETYGISRSHAYALRREALRRK